MTEKIYKLTVFNTFTEEYEEVLVTEDVYNECRRSEWRIDKNDSKHSKYTTPFSALVGGENGCYENFEEFIAYKDNPEKMILSADMIQSLRTALNCLTNKEFEIITLLFFKGLPAIKVAHLLGISEQGVNKRKRCAFSRIKKCFANFEK